jgi:hypothetical protein
MRGGVVGVERGRLGCERGGIVEPVLVRRLFTAATITECGSRVGLTNLRDRGLDAVDPFVEVRHTDPQGRFVERSRPHGGDAIECFPGRVQIVLDETTLRLDEPEIGMFGSNLASDIEGLAGRGRIVVAERAGKPEMRRHPLRVGGERLAVARRGLVVLMKEEEQISPFGLDVGPRRLRDSLKCVIGQLILAHRPSRSREPKVVVRTGELPLRDEWREPLLPFFDAAAADVKQPEL